MVVPLHWLNLCLSIWSIYVLVMILDLTIPFLTSGLDLRGSFQTGWLSPLARWSQLINLRVVFPDVSSFSFSVQYFFMVELTRFFHFGFGVHEILAAHKFPVFFLYCRKSFLFCHNSPKFASIPLLWFFHYGGTPMSSLPVPIKGLVRRSYTNE